MEEDPKFNEFVKAALERDASVPPGLIEAVIVAAGREARRSRIVRLARRWAPAALLAASLGIVASFVSFSRDAPCQPGVAETINLLWELEDVSERDLSAVSLGEMLLAWQEVPLGECGNEEM